MKRTLALTVLLISSVAAADSSRAWMVAKKLIPANMEMVGGVNVTTAHNSALYQALLPIALGKAGGAAVELDGIKSDCGIDVLNSIDSLAFGLDAAQKGTFVIAFRGVTRQKLEACVIKRAKDKGKALKVDNQNGLTVYSGMNDSSVYTRWVGSDVVALSTQPDDKDSTIAALAGGVGSDHNLHGLSSVNTAASIWIVTTKQGDVPAELGGGKVLGAFGSANVAGGTVNVEMHLGIDSPANATAIAAKSAAQLSSMGSMPTYGDLLKTVKVSSAASDVLVSAQLPEQAVLGLIKQLL